MTESPQATRDDAVDPKTERITRAIQGAVRKALIRYKRLGESIAVWQDGRVVILSADEIPAP